MLMEVGLSASSTSPSHFSSNSSNSTCSSFNTSTNASRYSSNMFNGLTQLQLLLLVVWTLEEKEVRHRRPVVMKRRRSFLRFPSQCLHRHQRYLSNSLHSCTPNLKYLSENRIPRHITKPNQPPNTSSSTTPQSRTMDH